MFTVSLHAGLLHPRVMWEKGIVRSTYTKTYKVDHYTELDLPFISLKPVVPTWRPEKRTTLKGTTKEIWNKIPSEKKRSSRKHWKITECERLLPSLLPNPIPYRYILYVNVKGFNFCRQGFFSELRFDWKENLILEKDNTHIVNGVKAHWLWL